MSYAKLKERGKIWKEKEIIRWIYLDWYKLIMDNVKDGKIVELGSGSGNFSQYYPNIISSDIIHCPWLEMTFDAASTPFKEESIDSLIMVDLLHHLEDLNLFFTEVDRVLKDKGRLIMIEPYISPFSFLIYHFLHQEQVVLNAKIFSKKTNISQGHKKDPFVANSAIPTILFWKKRKQFQRKYPRLKVIEKKLFSFLLYPLSGGFEHRSLIPMWWAGILNLIERLMSPLAKLLAFRTLIVIEKEVIK